MIIKTNFQFLIIALIIIIATCITGIYILDNIDIPKIETPSWESPTPTPTPTPTSAPVSIPIDPSIALLYNSSNITYDSNTTWNWSYTNFTNVSNWTYPPEINSNYTFVVGAGGSGGSGSSVNISYAIVAGGGGGAAGYTSVAYINSTPVAPVSKPTPQETLNTSQVISPIIFPMMEMWWFPIIFIIPLIFLTTSLHSSKPMVFILLFSMIGCNFFFGWNYSSIFIIISMMIILFITLNIFTDYRNDYYDR